METDSTIRLECHSQLELDLLMDLMNQYSLYPTKVTRIKTDGIEIILTVNDRINQSDFFGKLIMYEIYYTPWKN